MDLEKRQNLIEQMSIWVNADFLSKHTIAVNCADVAEKHLEEQLRLNPSSLQLPTMEEKYLEIEENLNKKNICSNFSEQKVFKKGFEICYRWITEYVKENR